VTAADSEVVQGLRVKERKSTAGRVTERF